MLLHRLRRFDAFSHLSPGDLTTAAEHARELRLPPGRWLVRRGRELSGSYFLERGRVRLYEPDGLVDDGSPRARQALYPGSRGVATLTSVKLLQVDTERLTGLFDQQCDAALPLYEGRWLTDGWESRFVGTRMMQRLRPGDWQRILRGMRRIVAERGERIVVEGERGAEFFVLCAGTAEVRSAGRCVARLQPGDFFGEDALITGGRRNATVVMVSDGGVMALSEALFRSDLLPLTIAPSATQLPLVALHAGSVRDLRERLRTLDPHRAYRVVGGSPGQRALAAFILTQGGFQVGAVAPDR